MAEPMVSDALLSDRWLELRQALVDRAKLTIAAGLMLGIAGIAMSDAGGPSAALLDVALLGLALWLGRSPSVAPAVTRAPASNSAMTGNQALLLVLALGGAAVLIAAGAASRPLHGLAVAPFAMAAFALSSQNSRDLRSGVLAAGASLLVLSSADSRAVVMTLCAVGLVPLVFGWAAVRQLHDDRPVPRPRAGSAQGLPALAAGAGRAARRTDRRPVTADAERAAAAPAPGGRQPVRSSDAAARGRGNAIAGAIGGLDLRDRGGLDAQPTIDVPADSPTLWQGGFVDTYTGTGPGSMHVHRRPAGLRDPDCRTGPGCCRSGTYRVATVNRLVAAIRPGLLTRSARGCANAPRAGSTGLVAGTVSVLRPGQPRSRRTRSTTAGPASPPTTLGVVAAPVDRPALAAAAGRAARAGCATWPVP